MSTDTTPIEDFAPVVIVSPSLRCGTTLVQRLLNSNPKGIIYGEHVATDIITQVQTFMMKQQVYGAAGTWYDDKLNRLLGGDANFWSPDLMPPMQGYLGAYKESAASIIRYVNEYANSAGRPQWGFKVSGWSFAYMNLVKMMMPKARFVYVHRHPVACVQSAKGVKIIMDDESAKQMAQQWVQNMQSVMQGGESIGLEYLAYKDLVADPQGAMNNIEAFKPYVGEIDYSIMDTKTNTDQVEGGQGYLEPETISDETAEAINTMAADVLAHFYQTEETAS